MLKFNFLIKNNKMMLKRSMNLMIKLLEMCNKLKINSLILNEMFYLFIFLIIYIAFMTEDKKIVKEISKIVNYKNSLTVSLLA